MAVPQRAPRVGGVEGCLGRRLAGRETFDIAENASAGAQEDVAGVARRHPKTSSRERRGISRPWCPRRPWAWYRSNQTRRAASRRHLRVFHQPRSSRPSRSTARTRVPGHVRALAVEKSFAKPEADLPRRRYARSSRARRPVAARGGRFGARRSSTGPRRRGGKLEAVRERRRCAGPSPPMHRRCGETAQLVAPRPSAGAGGQRAICRSETLFRAGLRSREGAHGCATEAIGGRTGSIPTRWHRRPGARGAAALSVRLGDLGIGVPRTKNTP